MEQYLTKKNILIGSGVLIVIIIIAVVFSAKKDNYTYIRRGIPTYSSPAVGTSFPDMLTGKAGETTLPSPSKFYSLMADNIGNLSVGYQFPVGGIIMWAGPMGSIPPGWNLCNGTNKTPDLRGRFIVGVQGQAVAGLTSFEIGDFGGEEFHQLTVEEMPPHTHLLNRGGGADYQNNISSGNDYNGSHQSGSTGGDPDSKESTDKPTPLTAFPHNNMPPFYALAYIMKVA